MSDTSELRALAQRLGNPLAVAGASGPTDVIVNRVADRSTADERVSPRASLERKLRAAKVAASHQNEP